MNILTPSTSTNRPTSEHVLHPKAFQSWRWVFLAAILMAAVAITTFYFSSAQAQNADGTVANLQLTSTTAGTLTVSWDAASPTPTDYRVDWAKSSEDYQSWKVDDGHVYTAETATTTTITDLAHDTEYKIRMRARYYRGEHEGKSWSGPWATATITVAGEPAEPVQQPPKEDPTQQPARDDPDPPAGTIETLTAADETGQLLLTWEAPAAPNATPTDYHVNWAKSTEDYPADTAEADNDHPTDTTLTLTGLDFDTDYNIRVRARYTSGDDAASHWNGPWTETTAQVKLPLPAAPFIGAIAVSPDREVLLSWFNTTQNDSITGYQVLRGPDADSLAVIEDDTGSTSTSYTDTAPPAGQTHTYGVKARNASGLGPQSDTATATVPEPEEEEELISSQQSSEETFVSNLGQAYELYRDIKPGSPTLNQSQMFHTGDNIHGYILRTVEFRARIGSLGNAAREPRVTINDVNGNNPGAVLHELTKHPDDSLSLFTPAGGDQYRFRAPEGTVLEPNRNYFIVLKVASGGFDVSATSSGAEDSGNHRSWSIANTSLYWDSRQGLVWRQFPNSILRLAISGEARQPTTEALQPTTDEPAAEDFPGAGHNAHKTRGYVTPGIVSTGHLTLGLDRNHGQTGDFWWLDTERGHSYRIEVEFGDSQNNDTGGSAWTYFIDGDRRGTCCDSDHNRNDGYTVLHIKHDQNRKYLIDVVVFDKLNSGSKNFYGPYTITMTDITGTEKVATNLYLGTRAPLSTVTEGNNEYAVSFTTGSHPGGYKLDRVRTHALNSTPLTRRALPEIKLRLNASGGTPGSALCNFLNPYEVQHHRPYAVKPLPVLFQGTHCDQVVLAAYTTYWLTLEGVGYQPTYTDSDDQQTSRSGWLIGNVAVNKTSGSWSNLSNGGTIPVEIWATTDLSRTRPDVPSMTVSFEQGTYTVAEGGTVEVTVTLDQDPERTVTIPLTKTNQGTASDADYSGVPANVVFGPDEREQTFMVRATDDTVDDDGESVQLGFGVLPTGVSTGGTATSTVSITDNDDPAVVVSFEQGTYTVAEGGTVEITVTLDVDPERTVTIPITKTNQGTASDADYSGVPANVVFGDVTLNNTSESFTFTATDDTIDDDGESVQLGFGVLPTGVSTGGTATSTVNITDNAAAGKVTLELTPATINESGTGNASTVTASIPSASSAATTVTVSVNPADTTTLTVNTILTIPAGDTNSTGVVTITAVNDDAVTGNRTVAVSGTAVNSVGITDPDDVTLTITDDDTAAMGDPLVRGERKVGATLTGDTQGITDGDGLTNPGFNYQWQRMENGMPEDIPGAVSETYTLTDDDVGKRVQLQVRFNDDEGTAEMRTGPATSVITKASHLLVGNLTRNVVGAIGAAYTQSTGLVTGSHEFGYAIEDVTAHRGVTGPLSDGDAEIRVYDSTSNTSPVLRKPKSLIMTADDLIRVNGLILDYSARSRAKLDPDTTYHIALAALSVGPLSCKTAHQTGVDSASLAGFSIIYRTYQLSDEGVTSGQLDRACALAIKGSELQSPNFVQEVEFTSTPAQPMIYATGETIEATVTLNQAVTFDGPPPVLLLQIGDNEREMTYMASPSTGTSWVFRYTVIADDRDDDGMSFNRFALRGYADADLSNNRVINDPEHRVNAVSQIVSRRVSSSPIAPMWYGPGEKIQFTLEFSLPVTVVGDPQLEFNVTTPVGAEYMSYESGSGTKELVFSYTVSTGDDDSDGIWWSVNSIRLDSDDSITGVVNGLDAELDHMALNKLENHRIDQKPRAVSQEVTSDPVGGTSSDTYRGGDMITFEVVFNQILTVSGSPRLRFSITGPGDEYATYVSGSGTNTLAFSYTVLATEMDADGIYLYDDPLNYPDANVDSIVGTSNNLDAVNDGIGKEGALSGHKVDGSITN